MIRNWAELNRMLPTMTQQQAQEHLLAEVHGQKRKTFILRLHQRYCVLRASDERRELIALLEESEGSRPLPPSKSVQLDNAQAMHQVSSSQAVDGVSPV